MNSADASQIAGALRRVRNRIHWDAHTARLDGCAQHALASFRENMDVAIADAENGDGHLKDRVTGILFALVMTVAPHEELRALVNHQWDELAYQGVVDERPLATSVGRADALAVVHQALTLAMSNHYAEAVTVDKYADEIPGWQPDPGHCHDQVAAWQILHPEDAALRGWVTWYGTGDMMKFASHSLVRTAAGEVVDVTEPRLTRYCFIEHPAGAGDFLALVRGEPPVPWVDVDASPRVDHRRCS
ncbi:hypothetical protein [Burkholderia gladioli]|uniref:hypothetical protein n=1 Tax=Burkholderia gladioli TaxID=28095 RepID=UPI001C5CEAF5|nr:hypothetical protein [Burkholderia gladioli]MBW5287914.1 hypothetical protein [Burkholderia gladioli]